MRKTAWEKMEFDGEIVRCNAAQPPVIGRPASMKTGSGSVSAEGADTHV